MVRIPEEYQEVEYIESTGTQYIELPFGFLDTDEIKIIACEMTMRTDKYMVAPLRWEVVRRFAMVGSYGNRFVVGFGAKGTDLAPYSPQQASDTKVHIWTYKNKIFSIIDLNAFYEWQEGSITQATANLRLFYGYNSPSIGRIYSYYHKKANENEINLIPCYRKSDNEIGMYDTVSKTFYTNSGTGTFLKGHNVYYDSINLLEQRRKILLNTPHLETVSNNIATFNTDMNVSLKDCKIYFSPIQEGEGDPSPDNVRPIRGWDGITIYHTGKNFFPIESGMRGGNADILLKANQIYTGSVKGPATPYIRLTYIDDTRSSYIWLNPDEENERSYKTFQPALDTKSIGFFLGGQMVQEMMIEKGNVIPKNFESYQSQTPINIPFPQTIYGGYVDLIKGEIVEEWHSIVFDGENIKANSDYSNNNVIRAYWVYFSPGGYNIQKAFCNKLTISYSYNDYDSSSVFPFLRLERVGDLYGGLVLGTPEDYPELASGTKTDRINAINNWFKENPTQVVYKLKNNVTYSLSSQILKTLKGTNNIFSDANGNIQVKFWKH